MANEFAILGVRVNAVSPGEIETESIQPEYEALIPSIPLDRMGTPNDVAGTIYYLCSDDASYVTSTEVWVTGGLQLIIRPVERSISPTSCDIIPFTVHILRCMVTSDPWAHWCDQSRGGHGQTAIPKPGFRRRKGRQRRLAGGWFRIAAGANTGGPRATRKRYRH